MTTRFTYWTDLETVQLSDDGNQAWVHALPVNKKYRHKRYGLLDFTEDRIKRFVANVKDRVRGIDPVINYNHKMADVAAGWVKDAEVRQNGLWLLVEWTKDALQKIKNREYRYLSSEFLDEWEDPSTGQTHKDVLVGAGLTNVPFIKDLAPINMSEIQEGEEVDRATLCGLLSLAEDASDDDIKAAITKLQEKPKPVKLSEAVFELSDNVVKVTHPELDGEATYTVELSDDGSDDELKKLTEEHPAVKALVERVNTLETATRLSEVDTQLKELGDAKKVIPPAAQTKFRNVMVRLPKALSDEVRDAIVELAKVGFVELGEKTTSKSNKGSQTSGDDATAFVDAVDKLLAEDKELDYPSAVQQVQLEDPDAYEAYRQAMLSGEYVPSEEG